MFYEYQRTKDDNSTTNSILGQIQYFNDTQERSVQNTFQSQNQTASMMERIAEVSEEEQNIMKEQRIPLYGTEPLREQRVLFSEKQRDLMTTPPHYQHIRQEGKNQELSKERKGYLQKNLEDSFLKREEKEFITKNTESQFILKVLKIKSEKIDDELKEKQRVIALKRSAKEQENYEFQQQKDQKQRWLSWRRNDVSFQKSQIQRMIEEYNKKIQSQIEEKERISLQLAQKHKDKYTFAKKNKEAQIQTEISQIQQMIKEKQHKQINLEEYICQIDSQRKKLQQKKQNFERETIQAARVLDNEIEELKRDLNSKQKQYQKAMKETNQFRDDINKNYLKTLRKKIIGTDDEILYKTVRISPEEVRIVTQKHHDIQNLL